MCKQIISNKKVHAEIDHPRLRSKWSITFRLIEQINSFWRNSRAEVVELLLGRGEAKIPVVGQDFEGVRTPGQRILLTRIPSESQSAR